MAHEWYYTENRERRGPVSEEQLKELALAGQLTPTDLVWKKGMAQWVAAGQIKGLFTAVQAPASPPPLPVAPPSLATPAMPLQSTEAQQPSFATETRTCEWCTTTIPSAALNCPHCGKLRKDIYKDKVLCWVYCFSTALPASLYMAGMRNGWWHVCTGFLSM
ncbi:MAG: DUF4339 domain-containing protein [Thermoguttaceae bacterium]|jgi:hypothetical protein